MLTSITCPNSGRCTLLRFSKPLARLNCSSTFISSSFRRSVDCGGKISATAGASSLQHMKLKLFKKKKILFSSEEKKYFSKVYIIDAHLGGRRRPLDSKKFKKWLEILLELAVTKPFTSPASGGSFTYKYIECYNLIL